jgi:hypothetical protein
MKVPPSILLVLSWSIVRVRDCLLEAKSCDGLKSCVGFSNMGYEDVMKTENEKPANSGE